MKNFYSYKKGKQKKALDISSKLSKQASRKELFAKRLRAIGEDPSWASCFALPAMTFAVAMTLHRTPNRGVIFFVSP
ncbi:MAG TPA: hypothetical protein VJU78_10405 [Chitinophagaceae bacterium]|nr:hypothetical protein [Chitinophagaceae bacterium]